MADKFRKTKSNFATTLVTGIGTGTGDTITLNSTTGLPTDTEITLTFNRVTSGGVVNSTSVMERITGTISGATLINYTRGVDGTTEQAHAGGVVVEYIPNAADMNDQIDGILVGHDQQGFHKFNAPEGFLLNGKIVPSVADDDLTVALKGLDGNDPSATNPIYVRIGDTVHSITSALSVTKAAGTNWFYAGSAQLATKEIDYFVYLGYNATDGVVIGFARIPYATDYSHFSATTTNEKYCAISTITNAAAGDGYTVIGRFAATLSAGAGYTWSVPTFTSINLIQRPIFETRLLQYQPQYSGAGSLTYTSVTTEKSTYRIIGADCSVQVSAYGTTGGSTNQSIICTLPIASEPAFITHTSAASVIDGTPLDNAGYLFKYAADRVFVRNTTGAVWGLGEGRYIRFNYFYPLA